MSDWRDDALCREVDPSLFFPLSRGDNMHEARRLCAACPVQAECLDDAVRVRDWYGYRGGMSGEARQRRYGSTPRPDLSGEVARLHGLRWTAQAIATRLGVDDAIIYRTLKQHRDAGRVVA